MRVPFPAVPPGTLPVVPNPSVPGQVAPSIPTPTVQPPQTLPTLNRTYPNIKREWFSSDDAHQTISLAVRQLFDATYDAQNAIQMLATGNPGTQLTRLSISQSGAVNPSQRANYLINAQAKAVLTLGAPRPTADDGTLLDFTSTTNFGHTLTTPGILLTGTASVNTATWPSFGGGTLVLEAQAGSWLVKSSNGITFS